MSRSVLMAPWSSPHTQRHVELTLLPLQVRCPLTFDRECAFLFPECRVPFCGDTREEVLLMIGVCSALLSPSTAQHPGDLCPHHEDNLLGDILCS